MSKPSRSAPFIWVLGIIALLVVIGIIVVLVGSDQQRNASKAIATATANANQVPDGTLDFTSYAQTLTATHIMDMTARATALQNIAATQFYAETYAAEYATNIAKTVAAFTATPAVQ